MARLTISFFVLLFYLPNEVKATNVTVSDMAALRAALNPGTADTIYISNGSYTLTNVLNITRAVTIIGLNEVVINMTGIERHFLRNTTARLELNNLVLAGPNADYAAGVFTANGVTTYGGGFQSSSTGPMVIINCKIGGCSNNANGGAINLANNTSSLQLLNSLLQSNVALNNGGGVYCAGQLLLGDDSILNNKAGYNITTGIYAGSYDGGGVYANNILTVQGRVVIAQDTATRYGGGMYKGTGAINTGNADSLYVFKNQATNGGGGIYMSSAGKLQNAFITNNSAGAIGGGIATFGADTLLNVRVDSNSVGNQGGGIYANSFITIQSSKVLFNKAGLNATTNGIGGGLYTGSTTALATISNSNFLDNRAYNNGGGIYTNGPLLLTSDTVSLNKAAFDSRAGADTFRVIPVATGIVCSGAGVFANNSITLSGSILFERDTTIFKGGGIYKSTAGTFTNDPGLDTLVMNYCVTTGEVLGKNKDPEGCFGGAIFTASNTRIKKTRFFRNSAGDSGGAIWGNLADITLEDVTAIECKAGYNPFTRRYYADCSGGVACTEKNIKLAGTLLFERDTAANTGGALCAWGATSTVTSIVDSLQALTITGCATVYVTDTFGAFVPRYRGQGGAIVSNKNIDLHAVDTIQILDNISYTHGGGLYCVDGGISISRANINGNTARYHGGGLYAPNGSVFIDSCNISNNRAGFDPILRKDSGAYNGGAIYALKEVRFRGGIILDNNTANNNGGAIAKVLGGKFDISGVTIFRMRGNKTIGNFGAAANGGAMYIEDSLRLDSSINLEITNNTAAGNGGAIYSKDRSLALNSITISNNHADKSGGAIWSGGTLQITRVRMDSNSASMNGGAIFSNAGRMQMSSSSFLRNTATSGGAFYSNTSPDSNKITNCTFYQNTVSGNGGAIYSISPSEKIDLTFNTFNGNSATSDVGHAIFFAGTSNKRLRGNIIYGNGASGTEINQTDFPIASYNIVRNVTLTGGTGNMNIPAGNGAKIFENSTAEDEGTLANNGGLTQTVAIKKNGYAHNLIATDTALRWPDDFGVIITDQRDSIRPGGCSYDAGAYEIQSANDVASYQLRQGEPICYNSLLNPDTLITNAVNIKDTFFYADRSYSQQITTFPIVIKGQNRIYVRFITTSNCEIKDSILLDIKARATAADLNIAGATVCNNVSATLTGTSLVQNPIYKWYANADLTNAPLFTGSIYKTPPLNASTSYYVTVQGANVCENAPDSAKKVDVTINTACGSLTPVGCSATGSRIYLEDFAGEAPSDPAISSTPLPPGRTSYRFAGTNQPVDGDYTLSDHVSGSTNDWYPISDHGRQGGYMAIFNADQRPGVFYKDTIRNLCSGANMFFSSWIVNLLKPETSNGFVDPNILYVLTNAVTGDTLSKSYTGDIAKGDTSWKQYGFDFIVPQGVNSVALSIVNNASGGSNGNDLALDDIAVYVCLPPVTITGVQPNGNYCTGDTLHLTAQYTDDGTLGTGYVYQWYYSANDNKTTWSGWSQIAGANTSVLNTPAKTGYYRVVAGSAANITAGNFNCMPLSLIVHVTVNEGPFVNAITGPNTVCQGSSVKFTNSTSGGVWSSSDVAIATVDASGNLTGVAAGNATISYMVTNTTTGCSTSVSAPVTVNAMPTVAAISNQESCADNAGSTTSTPVVLSGTIAGTTFNWSMNNAIGYNQSGSGNIPSFAYFLPAGASAVTSTVTIIPAANGCAGTPGTFTYTLNPYPNVDVSVNDAAQCLSDNKFVFTNNTTIPGGGSLSYEWSFDDGTKFTTAGDSHNFTVPGIHSYSLIATSAKGCQKSLIGSVTVTPQPVASFNYSIISPNSNDEFAFTNTSSSPSGTTGMSYFWEFGDGTTSTLANPTHAYTTAGTYTVTLTITSVDGCSSSASETISVSKDPNIAAGFSINNAAQCVSGNNFTFTNTSEVSNGVTITSYAWDLGDGSTSSAVSPSHTYTAPGTYIITLRATISTGFTDVVTGSVNVFGTPNVVRPSNQVMCNNTASEAVLFESTSGSPAYTWTNNNASIGLPASGSGNIASFTAKNTGAVPVVSTLSVTPVQNGCPGASQSFTITINPTPDVTGYSNQEVCNKATVAAENFTSKVSGTSFNWTNDNTTIGLAANGTGSIPSFNALNNSATTETATIEITPSALGCEGTIGRFTITVNPSPALTSQTNAVGICSGTSFGYTPTSSLANTSYTWSRQTIAGITETSSSGAGSINEILTNTTNNPITVSYNYMLTSGSGCQLNEVVSFPVNPVPAVSVPVDISTCNNTQLFVPAFSSNIAGSAFLWDNTETAIGLNANGTGNISPFVAGNNTNAVLISTISVAATKNYSEPGFSGPALVCTGLPHTFTITVYPTVSIEKLNDTTVCPSALITMPPFNASAQGTAYTWAVDKNIGLPLSGTGNLPAFTSINQSTSPVTASVVVTPAIDGCPGNSVASKIIVRPTAVSDFAINDNMQCLAGNSFAFTDLSAGVSNLDYLWNFGDGATSTLQNPGHTYSAPGAYQVTQTVGLANTGCSTSSISKTVTVNPTPNPAFIYAIVSPNANDNFQFTSKSTISSGSIVSYSWNFGDGTTSNLMNSQHTYSSEGTYTVTLTVTSNFGCSSTTSQEITVSKAPNLIAGFTINNANQCLNNNSFQFTNASVTSGTHTITSYEWNFGDGTPSVTSKDATHTYTTPATYIVTLTATLDNGFSDLVTQSVTILATPDMIQPDNEIVCGGGTVSIIRFKPVRPGLTFTWTNDHPEIGLPATGNGNSIASFTAVNSGNTPIVATITVTPHENNCDGPSKTFTITVNPVPVVAGFSDQVVCAGSATADIIFTSNVAGTNFNWTNDNSATGIAASGTGNIPSVTVLNAGTVPQTSAITVVPSVNGCTGNAETFTVTANPLPLLTSATNAGSICTGSTFNYTPKSSTAGVTFNWSRAAVPGISNVAAAGAGDPAEVLINTTTAPVVVIYQYQLSANNCTGAAVYNVQVTVNPHAMLSSSTTPPAVCNNTRFSYQPQSATTGVSFAWSRAADAYNTAATGNGNPFEVLHNGGTSPLPVTYQYTLTANNCISTTQQVQVIVNPDPIDDFTTNSPQCLNGNNFIFSLNPNNGEPSYSWNFGDGATATGSNPSHSYSFAGIYPVTLTVTSAAGCIKTIQHPVAVNPSPVAQFVYNTVAPNSSDNYQFTDRSIIGDGTLASYAWDFGDGNTSTTQNPTHIYAAGGTYIVSLTVTSALGCSATVTETLIVNKDPNVIAGFSINNNAQCISANSFSFTDGSTTATGITITGYTWDFGDGSPANNTQNPTHVYAAAGNYIVRLHVTGTDGTNTFTDDITESIIVFNTPDMLQPADQIVCNQAATLPVIFRPVQPGLSFTWTMSSDIGTGTTGTGNIASFTANNAGNTTVTSIVTVTPTANGCAGSAKTFSISVNPTPIVAGLADQFACAGSPTTAVTFTGSVTGSTFTWFNNNTYTGLPASGTNNIPSTTALNSGSDPQISIITVMPSANGCDGASQAFNITVNPLPVMTSTLNPENICSGDTMRYSPQSSTNGVTFTWTRAEVAGISNAAANGTGDIKEQLINTTAAPVTVSYAYSLSANGCNAATVYDVKVIVNPTATLSSTLTPSAICSNTVFSYQPTSTIPGTGFNWTRPFVNGISNAAASGTGNPNETLINITDLPITVSYVYDLTSAGCISQPQIVQVIIDPLPLADFTVNDPLQCIANNNFQFTNTSTYASGGLSYLWNLDDGNTATTKDVEHSYAYDGVYSVALTATTDHGCVAVKSKPVTVSPSPVAHFIYNVTSVNSDDEYQFTSTSTISSGSLFYKWDFGDGATSTLANPTHAYISGGTYKVTLIVSSSSGCSDTTTQDVTVSKTQDIQPGFVVNNAAQCFIGNSFLFTNVTIALRSTPTYLWKFGDGSTSTSKDATHSYAKPGVYIVELSVTGDRGYNAVITQSVVVFPMPSVIKPANQQLCSGANTVNINFNGSLTSARYNWTNDHPEIGLPSSGTGNIASFTALNAGNIPVTAHITVSPVSNGCTGSSEVFTITVNPAPDVNQIADQTLCNGQQTTAIQFTGNIPGTEFNWMNNNSSVGLISSGSGNINPFTARNDGNNLNKAIIQVTPAAGGCQGATQTFALNVQPTPHLTNADGRTICDSTLFSFEPTGTVSGTVFSWARKSVQGLKNPSASGTGNPAEVLDDTTAVSVQAVYTYTLKANGCDGDQRDVVVAVNPKPVLTNNIAPPEICNNTAFNFSPSSSTPGTEFVWQREAINGISNLPATGTNNSNEVLHNTSNVPLYVTYKYALSAGGCSNTYNIGVTVTPTLRLSGETDPTAICSGATFDYLMKSAVSGTSFAWSRAAVEGITNPAAKGTGNIHETLVNSTNTPLQVVYTDTVKYNKCSNTQHIVVTVNPSPTISNVLADKIVCEGANVDSLIITGSVPGTVYNWSNNNTMIGLGGNGAGTIPRFVAQNTGDSSLKGIITIRPVTPNGCALTQPVSFNITIDPLPAGVVTAPLGTVLCERSSLPLVATGGNSYQWYKDSVLIPGATSAQLIVASAGTYSVSASTAAGCKINLAGDIHVSGVKKPKADFAYSAYCVNTPITFINQSTVDSSGEVSYTWTDNAGHTSNAASPVFNYTQPGSYSVKLIVSPTSCPMLTDSITKTINVVVPLPGTQLPIVYTSMQTPTPLHARDLDSTKYLWQPSTGLNDSTVANPIATLDSSQLYLIAMTTPSGCITTDTLLVSLKAPLIAWKAVTDANNDSMAEAGEMLTYIIHVKNTGSQPLSGLLIYDSIPAHTVYVAGSGGELNGKRVEFANVNINAGDSVALSFNVKVDSALADVTSISNIAYVHSNNGGADQPTCTSPDGCAGGSPTLLPVASLVDLKIVKRASDPIRGTGDVLIGVNETYYYLLAATNNGRATAHDVVITDTLSPVINYSSSTADKGSTQFDPSSRALKWLIDSLKPAEAANLTIVVSARQDGSVINTATISSAEDELNPADNISTITTSILALKIPNTITPNGDGHNDKFVIKGLELFPENQLVIFNRWNNKIYEKKNYTNDWDGSHLNAGTYYYELKLKDKNGQMHNYKGYIMLLK